MGDGRVDPGGGNEIEGEGIEGEDEGGSEDEGDRERECEGEGAGEEQWENIVEPELIAGDDGEINWQLAADLACSLRLRLLSK